MPRDATIWAIGSAGVGLELEAEQRYALYSETTGRAAKCCLEPQVQSSTTSQGGTY